jgi:hypothetical protein
LRGGFKSAQLHLGANKIVQAGFDADSKPAAAHAA